VIGAKLGCTSAKFHRSKNNNVIDHSIQFGILAGNVWDSDIKSPYIRQPRNMFILIFSFPYDIYHTTTSKAETLQRCWGNKFDDQEWQNCP